MQFGSIQLFYCYIKRYVAKLMRFILFTYATLERLKSVTNVSYRCE